MSDMTITEAEVKIRDAISSVTSYNGSYLLTMADPNQLRRAADMIDLFRAGVQAREDKDV